MTIKYKIVNMCIRIREKQMMADKELKEFNVKEYMHNFEKSLNYMVAVLFAISVTAVWYFCQGMSWSDLQDALSKLYYEPKEIFYVIVAVLPTLPYYFCYTLKNDLNWTCDIKKRDMNGLLKIFVFYEVGVMSIIYLLMQKDLQFSASKLIIAAINIVLLSFYIYLVTKEYQQNMNPEKSIEYFYILVIFAAFIFLYLLIHSVANLIKGNVTQNFTVLGIMLLFAVNTGINTFFLANGKTDRKIGIISNRIKIMIPILSVSTFPVSVFYCYWNEETSWKSMLFIAAWITFYEIILSLIKCEDTRHKVFLCIITFIVFVFGVPFAICQSDSPNAALIMNWFILLGVSIYMAAIKYWGYILINMYHSKCQPMELEPEMVLMVTWFRNSILGSMLFMMILLLNEQYFFFLLGILFLSICSEWFVYHYILDDKMKPKNKGFNRRKVFEFISITLPIIFFMITTIFDLTPAAKILFAYLSQSPQESISIMTGVGCILIILVLRYITRERKRSKDEPIQTPEKFFSKILKNPLEALEDSSINIISALNSALHGTSRKKLIDILCAEFIYIVLYIVFLITTFSHTENILTGVILLFVVGVLDWFFVSKYLVDYYIGRIKMGDKIFEFRKIFIGKWKTLLDNVEVFQEKSQKQLEIGERLRPILFFMGSSYNHYDEFTKPEHYESIAQAACSLELIHKASLILDDFIDQDTLRHGEPTFYKEFEDKSYDKAEDKSEEIKKYLYKIILWGNKMLAMAYDNFIDCKDSFKCGDTVTLNNLKKLSQIIEDLDLGCYKELAKGSYEKETESEVDEMIYLETVSLIQGSMELGYSCFHEAQGESCHDDIEELGKALGYIFQWLNDLEPYSQKNRYSWHKGNKENFDSGKKSIVLWTLTHELTEEEKQNYDLTKYKDVQKLFVKKKIEDIILKDVYKKIEEINSILQKLEPGNESWCNAFRELFDKAMASKDRSDLSIKAL